MSEINPFIDVEDAGMDVEEASGTGNSNIGGMSIGSGSTSFRADSSGIWLGSETWATAPFRVDMSGNMVASSANLTGSGYTKTVTFAQAAIPTSVAIGDLWVDTDNENRIYRAESVGANAITAGEWVDVSDSFHLDKVGGTYNTTLLTAAKVQIFPTTSIGIRAYASNGTSVVFQVNVGGTDVGDVILGNYSGGSGVLWDQSDGTLYIRGNMTAGSIDADDVTITNIDATSLNVATLSSITANMGTLTAGTISAGTILLNGVSLSGSLGIGGGGVQPSNLIIAYSSMTSAGSGAYLRFGSASGSRIWADSNNDMGFNAIGGEMYFYCNSAQILYLDDNAQAVIGQDNSTYDVGLYVWGGFNTGRGNARIKDGAVWINTTSDHTEKLWVEGSAKVTDNFKSDHHDPNGNKSYNLGGDSTAWDYVYADDYINKSLGWYDNGVELQDGTIVSDMEAIRQIQPHKSYLNKNGSIGLDWLTLPLCVFREAHDRDTGEVYKKNKDGIAISPETGELVGDGESITGMVSLLMGALKEVDQRVLNIEKGTN